MPEFKTQFGANCLSTSATDTSASICPKDAALIVAILSAGTAIGALLAAPAGDSLGRRITLLISVGIFCIGAICQVCAYEVVLLLIGRYDPARILSMQSTFADLTLLTFA
jgi:MFS family permease